MQIVINIPKSRYKLLQKQASTPLGREKLDEFTEAVLNGKPLPEGHGRLKDFDKIEWSGCDFEGKACEKANGDCSVCNFGNCDAKQLRDLPTIVEADYELSDEKTVMADVDEKYHTATVSVYALDDLINEVEDLTQLKTVLGKIKKELHTLNKETCDYEDIPSWLTALEHIDEIVEEYETENGEIEINEEGGGQT